MQKDHRVVSALATASALLVIPIALHVGVPFPITPLLALAFVAFVVLAENIGLYLADRLSARLPFLRRLARFGATGVFNTIFDASIFNALIFFSGVYSGLPIILFTIVAFVSTLFVSYFINRSWSFEAEGSAHVREFSLFSSVVLSSILLNVGLMYVLTSLVGTPAGISGPLWAIIARIICAVFSLVWNFTGLHFFVFRTPR